MGTKETAIEERLIRMSRAPLVLVIEDDVPVRTLMGRALEAAGYRVASVSTALDAVAVMRREHPDLILTDLMLPGLDGANASISIKGEPGMASIPVILVSGAPDLAERALETDAADHIAKPFMPGELVRRVRRVLTAGMD